MCLSFYTHMDFISLKSSEPENVTISLENQPGFGAIASTKPVPHAPAVEELWDGLFDDITFFLDLFHIPLRENLHTHTRHLDSTAQDQKTKVI